MILFIIFVIIPLIEISLFVTVGEEIGLFNTLFLCLLTAMGGAVIIRHQGLKTLLSARSSMSRNEMPLHEIFDGICIAVSGALLMTPGFFTDGIGFALLVPQIRDILRKELSARFEVQGSQSAPNRGPHNPDIIEAEYERLDERDKP